MLAKFPSRCDQGWAWRRVRKAQLTMEEWDSLCAQGALVTDWQDPAYAWISHEKRRSFALADQASRQRQLRNDSSHDGAHGRAQLLLHYDNSSHDGAHSDPPAQLLLLDDEDLASSSGRGASASTSVQIEELNE